MTAHAKKEMVKELTNNSFNTKRMKCSKCPRQWQQLTIRNAQNIPEYTTRMHELNITDPDMWQEFVNSATLVQATLSLSLALVYIKQWSI